MKKIFGGINLTWSKVIIMSIIIGIYTAIMAMLTIAKDTSFSDLTVTFEVWIFFGIFIIMNSKSPKDSALKCFVFFLISQPLVYLVQDAINHSHLFNTYYRYWFIWTIACLPMGFIGYYMKKDKWWGLLILIPILGLLSDQYGTYLSKTMFSFPRHILTTIFCLVTLIVYPLAIFKNKKTKITGIIISSLIIIIMTVLCIIKPPIYSTDILLSGEKYQFDNTYKVYLADSKYGDLNIRYEAGIKCWMVHAEFKKAGKTKFILESPSGEKQQFDISIKRDTYEVKEKKQNEVNNLVNIIINDNEYTIVLEDNETAKSFVNLLPQEYNMSELNGNEKYIYLDSTLPTNTYNPKKINAGDVMLYADNCLVIFYKSFDTTYSYTKIGHIDNLPDLGNGNVTVKFEK